MSEPNIWEAKGTTTKDKVIALIQTLEKTVQLYPATHIKFDLKVREVKLKLKQQPLPVPKQQSDDGK